MREIALFSTWDKEGIGSIARALAERGMEIVATGNTRTLLEKEGLKVTDISELTGEPERFGGRIKTLHHRVFGGILFRPGQDDAEWPEGFRVAAVVCNFYPFLEKVKDTQTLNELIEWVDIGGPSMVRAAAKNHKHVLVFTRSEQYTRYIASPESQNDEAGLLRMRERFAMEAFELVSELDQAISRHFKWRLMGQNHAGGELTYGENPHQRAHFEASKSAGLALYGNPSFNNMRDAEAAFRFVSMFKYPAVSVIKHQTLCGAAAGLDRSAPSQVFKWAWEGDTVSRFGGIIGFNFLPGPDIQEILRTKFLEVIVMPRTPGSERLAQDLIVVKPKLRFVLVEPHLYESNLYSYSKRAPSTRLTPGEEVYQGWLGRLAQQTDGIEYDADRDHTDEAHFDRFGQWAAGCSKSNAMVLAGHDKASGISYLAGTGQGQPNRLDSLRRLALPRAIEFAQRMNVQMRDLSCFSDAFLSHTDSLEHLREADVRRLVQPGGSKADEEVKLEAAKLGIEMQITGIRHFWH